MRVLFAFLLLVPVGAQTYDVVIRSGRVMDPESNLDAVRDVGISGGRIAVVSEKRLEGRVTVDASGKVVAPGFVDLHRHGQTPDSYRYQVLDGVTTSLELEIGTADVARWYAERAGQALVNHGVSIGHVPVRGEVVKEAGRREATEEEISDMKRRIERGLQQGATAVGFGVAYTPAASRWEILEMFRVAARFGAPAHVHMRSAAGGGSPVEGLQELIAAAAITGAPLQVVHINSSGLLLTPRLLQMIEEARSRGLDVTTECYPYTAGATSIEAALFDTWVGKPESEFQKLQWVATGERLTAESFARYRKTGGSVIVHTNTEEMVDYAVAHPLTMIGSDGGNFRDGRGHPRSSGTYARILGVYVREKKLLSLMDALRKMTVMPARRLEARVPSLKNKGRLRAGADADVTVFDPERVRDRSTYEKPAVSSEGIEQVLVNGVFVVKDGQVQEGAAPGKPVRAPLAP